MFKITPCINERHKQCLAYSKKSEKYAKRIEDLMTFFSNETNLVDFKHELLAMTQLYFDGLLNRASKSNIENNCAIEWSERLDTLDGLVLAGKKTIRSLYCGEEISFADVRDSLNYSRILADSVPGEAAKKRHLVRADEELYYFGCDLQKRLYSEIEMPDTLVCISSGALEPTCLLMNLFGLEEGNVVVVRYSGKYRKDSEVQTLERVSSPESKILNKKVMIVDDITTSGDSLLKTMESVLKFNPSSVYAVAVKGEPVHPLKVDTITLNRINPYICKYVGD